MTLSVAAVLLFLMASLLLYTLFGGADFGAGILEPLVPKQHRAEARKLVSRAIAPVWEANHVWLILAVVILFVGFPRVYTSLTVYLHLPVLALLMGIVGRGCAFTFRHYDTPSIRYHRLYSAVFSLSSLWCGLWLGVIAGAVTLGWIRPEGNTFGELYIYPWLNIYCVATAVFAVCLFTLLASVFLTGEAQAPALHWVFLRASAISNVAVVAAGAMVFAAAHYSQLDLFQRFFTNPVSLTCFALATLLLVPFWRALLSARGTLVVRATGAAIVALVLGGWFAVQFPLAVAYWPPTPSLDFASTAAPPAVMHMLLMALVLGSLLIFPALFYLLRVFKWETLEREPGAEGRS